MSLAKFLFPLWHLQTPTVATMFGYQFGCLVRFRVLAECLKVVNNN